MTGVTTTTDRAMPIAIVGIGCRFPGGVRDAAGFWRLLIDGVDAITDIPADRFDIEAYYDPKPGTRGRIMTKWGGFVDQRLEEFDAAFFGVARSYAERLDPQQRLLLETSWEAMEDAGVDAVGLEGTPTGIFVGQWVSDFEHRLFNDTSGIDFQMAMGSGRYAAAGRLSYAFGFRGPSLSIDAACSSGLASVHLAVRSLRSGDSKVALAGGVNMILEPHIHLAYSYSRMMAPDGRCRFGDAAGSGYVRAEGAGMVVLKPLADALADGDRVYAVIRGSAVNNDGNSSGSMGRPSRIGQEELLRSALRDGDVHASQLDYVEAHGTGTRAGDPVELGALATVLSEGREPGAARTLVGSVKTNFGHTEAAAGIAGLIKTALMMQHRMIPPSLHFSTPNVDVPWATIPIAIPTALAPWPARDGPIFAGISSYGIGGTNAHVVLESAPATADVVSDLPAPALPAVLPISARSSKAALRAVAAQYAALLEDTTVPLHAVCAAAATRRSALTHRAAFVAADRELMLAALRAFVAGDPATADGVVYDKSPRKLAFVVPGQGAQWPGMAREFAAQVPVFRAALEECDAAARAHVSWSIVEQLHLDPGAPGWVGDRIDVIQPTLIAMAIAYAAWLRSVGIKPDAVVGHSLGEVGAACIAGVIDIPTAMRVICQRSALMQRTSGQGAMAMVELSQEDTAARLTGFEARVSVAVSNSPKSSVISGDPRAVDEILAGLQRDGVFCRLVKVDVASHSPQMEPLVPELVASLSGLRAASGTVPIYSTVRGALVNGAEYEAAYWGLNLRQPVQFGAAVQRMLDDDITAFIELGPHPVLTQAVQQVAQAAGRDTVAVACGRRESPDVAAALTVIATLWTRGAAIDWQRVMPWRRQHVALPFYPWQRERFWADAAEVTVPAQHAGTGGARARKVDAAMQKLLHTFSWKPLMPSAAPDDARTVHWIVVADAASPHAAAYVAALQSGAHTATRAASMHDTGVLVRSVSRSAGEIRIVVLPETMGGSLAYAPVVELTALQAALRAASSPVTPRVWWITSGAHVVSESARITVDPYGAALWGAARVLAEEHPDWWGGLLDLDPESDIGAQADHVARALSSFAGEDQMLLRGGQPHALRLVSLADAKSATVSWRADAAYLISGGFGGMALKLAHAMLSEGARRLVLLSRTPLPPRAEWATLSSSSPVASRVAAVRALEHAGASVHVMTADVADEGAMRLAIAAYRAEGWPDIDGVVHAAGMLESHLSADMTEAAFARVLSAKLTGADVLDRLLPDVGRFLICSSIMSFWGAAGMSNYAAANAGCDAIAVRRRAAGRAATSVQWCVWKDTGLVDDAQMVRNVDAMSALGLRAITEAEGIACFSAALARQESTVTVLPIDWAQFGRARRGRVPSLYRDIAEVGAVIAAPDGWLQRIATASPPERTAVLESLVRGVVSDLLRRPADAIASRATFGSMGVDSLLALEVRTRLESALERPLSATLAWNYPTVDALAAYLAALLAPPAPVASAPEPVPSSAAADVAEIIVGIGALSDDDALRALRGTR